MIEHQKKEVELQANTRMKEGFLILRYLETCMVKEMTEEKDRDAIIA